MSDARVTLTVDGPATVKLIHRDSPRREPQEPEPEQRQWWPGLVSEDCDGSRWESFK